jgi:DNA-binding CsgD family transcriptional regulator/PAS domain-containing protein
MEDLSSLIGQIYDTITDPALWATVLGEIGDYAEADRATLILEDAIEPLKSGHYQSYSDPDWLHLYMEQYLLINPMRLATASSAMAGDVILTTDFMSNSEYSQSRFSRELLQQRGLVDIAAAILEKTATSITVLSLKRSAKQGFADETLRRKLTLIAPHVRRAAAIGQAFEQKALAAAALADTMDELAGALFLLDARGGIVHANAGAERLLAEKDVLRRVGGVLVPRDGAARSALTEALAAAAAGDIAMGSRGTSIPFATTSDQALFGTVMPLTGGARRTAGLRYKAVAALSVRAATFAVPSDLTALERLYDLTQRETTVLLTIAEAGGVRETAAILGLSEATVKSYLKSLFAKTGAKRQADLIKILAGAASPFKPR